MSLSTLIYSSKINHSSYQSNTLENILDSAHRNNLDMGVTGFLMFDNNYFLQCLEGNRQKISELYHKISGDERHTEIQIIKAAPITQRLFNKWSMGYLAGEHINRELLMKYCDSNIFEPHNMSPESCLAILVELANQSELTD